MSRRLLHWGTCQFGGIRGYRSDGGVYGDKKLTNLQLEHLIQDLRAKDLLNFSRDQCSLSRFVHAYRSFGHRIAQLNLIPELLPEIYGLDPTDGSKISVKNLLYSPPSDGMSLQEITSYLRELYCGKIGVEFQHLETIYEREWFCREFETIFSKDVSDEILKDLARLMLKCQNFDHYLAAKFSTVKRYGGEGAESMLAFFYKLFHDCPEHDVTDLFIGMPHRGRLNFLCTMLDYPAVHMFQKMRGKPEFPTDVQGLGDVLSHLSTSVDVKYGKKPVHVVLLPCPSHLEAVNPVAAGKTRGRQQSLKAGDYDSNASALPGDRTLCVLVHGDAAIAGQGVNMETLAIAHVPHFRIGGTIHLVVNNQLGYTTPPERGRSSEYCTDLAKMNNCPAIHVNADHPEMLLKATHLALKYRQLFRKDVFIDLQCFRRWGHNELDDPSFTQPLLYNAIGGRKSIPDVFAENLVERNIVTKGDLAEITKNDWAELDKAFQQIDVYKPKAVHLEKQWQGLVQAPNQIEIWETGVDVSLLKYIGARSVRTPDGMEPHPHLKKTFIDARIKKIEEGTNMDWSTAEAMAIGSLLMQGVFCRISGQDVGRGTFSQRHSMLVDMKTDEIFIPLNHLMPEQKAFLEVCNSILSEEAVLGFEYGFSIENPQRLVVWEAQFGDFFNGAQIIIDTFITGGETKWLQQSGIVMLLPHGYDGAGPEHSSCRIERFLQLCDSKETAFDGASVNFEIVHPTTSAQYFHLLRRQMIRNYRKPLIVASPKTLLRLTAASSNILAMSSGTHFLPVIGDETVSNASAVKKVILCCGKHFYALDKFRLENKIDDCAIVRTESLCPFPATEISAQISKFPNAKKFIWSQEEPRNQGPWFFIRPRVRNLCGVDLEYVGRAELPIPAVAIGELHQKQHDAVIRETFS